MNLAKYKVRDLPLPKELVTLRYPEQRLFDGIQVLSKRHLLSAPVLDDAGMLFGMLDALDIVALIVRLAAEGKPLEDQPLDEVMGKSHPGGGALAQVSLDDTVDKVLNIVSGPARRAVVVGPSGSPYSIVTQSVLLQFLNSKRDELNGLLHCGCAKELCSNQVVTVNESETALAAFETIHRLGVWSVVVLDEDGCMLTVISATDLVVGLAHMTDKTKVLEVLRTAGVVEFVAVNRCLDFKAKASTVCVPLDMPLEEIMEKLAVCHVHRVVVCADHKPLGVLSLTDVCKAVARRSDTSSTPA